MSIVKLNNRSVKDATAFGSITSLGELTFISKQTASASANISFTSGIDSTYKEYIFYFVNCHPSTDAVQLNFNLSTDGGSTYNVTKTTTIFLSHHAENDAYTEFAYDSNKDLAQSTAVQNLTAGTSIGGDNDQSLSGFLHLFNPSSTTFVKHFIARTNTSGASDSSSDTIIAGYGNTTSAVDAIQFSMSSGNIDSGDIILFGLN